MHIIKTKFNLDDKVFIRYQGAGEVLSGKVAEIETFSTKDGTRVYYGIITEVEIKSSNYHYVEEPYVKKNRRVPIQ